MRVRLLCAFLALMVSLPAIVGADNTPRTLTLEECVSAARSSGDELAIIQGNLAASRAQYAQAVSSDSFAVSGSAAYGVAGALGDSGLVSAWQATTGVSSVGSLPQTAQAALTLSNPSTSISLGGTGIIPLVGSSDAGGLVSIGASQSIWDGYPGGTSKATVQKSLLSLHAAEITADTDTASLVYTVKQAYLTMLASQRTLQVKREILARQESTLTQMEASGKLQQATAVDVETARINVLSAQIDVAAEQDTLRAARVSLANLCGLQPGEEFIVAEVDQSTASNLTLAEATTRGLEKRAELRNLALELQRNDIDRVLIEGLKTPTVSVSGTGYAMLGANAATGASALSASVSVSMPVLDAGSALHKEEENLANRQAYLRQQSQKKKTISLEIEKAYNALQRRKESLELARKKAENADAYYQVEKAGNRFGTVTNHDVLAASVDAASAQVSYASARNDVLLAELFLQNTMGY